jgi:hypothetical protein
MHPCAQSAQGIDHTLPLGFDVMPIFDALDLPPSTSK